MKYRHLASCLAVAAPFISTSALAEPGGPGLDLGARLAYGIPMGEAQKDVDLGDVVSYQIPLWLDLGYRFNANIMAGAYFSYGIAGVPDDNCPSPADCSASVMRLGLQAQYRLSPGESVNPWLGVGLGLEWASNSAEAGGTELTGSASGMEFLMLQGGADFKVAEGVGIGPFLSFSLAQYGSGESCVNGDCTDGDIDETAMHQWLMLGVRGAFEL